MKFTGTVFIKGLLMLTGGIAFIACPVVFGKLMVQILHVIIPIGLCQNAGGSNGSINAITLDNGTLTNQTFSNRTVDVTLANQIIANPNGYYFNVHSAVNPGGAVRAQLVKQ